MSKAGSFKLDEAELEKISGGTDWNADYVGGVMNYTKKKDASYWGNSDAAFWQGELQHWQSKNAGSACNSNTFIQSSQMVGRIKGILGV